MIYHMKTSKTLHVHIHLYINTDRCFSYDQTKPHLFIFANNLDLTNQIKQTNKNNIQLIFHLKINQTQKDKKQN